VAVSYHANFVQLTLGSEIGYSMLLGNPGSNRSSWSYSIQASTVFKEFGITMEEKLYATLVLIILVLHLLY